MFSRPSVALRAVFAAVLAVFVVAVAASAQEASGLPQAGAMAQQSLRPYWHVFIAYAIAVLFVLGWVVSIARRLAALERRLVD